MSRFLAPIHELMYSKIKRQAKINEDLMDIFFDENIKEEVYKHIGRLEEGDLADIIDHNNIHGWLQENVDLVEGSYAYIIENYDVNIDELKKWFYEEGKKEKQDSIVDLFNHYTNLFLDGMPCDRSIEVLSQSDSIITWSEDLGSHAKYWKDGGKTYRLLRDEFLKAMVEESGFKLGVENNIYEVSK